MKNLISTNFDVHFVNVLGDDNITLLKELKEELLSDTKRMELQGYLITIKGLLEDINRNIKSPLNKGYAEIYYIELLDSEIGFSIDYCNRENKFKLFSTDEYYINKINSLTVRELSYLKLDEFREEIKELLLKIKEFIKL